MSRIFDEYAYGPGPRSECWWDHTCTLPSFSRLAADRRCDVVVIGGGFTGISAALHLAQSGASVCVLEEKSIGWGASGRNGGFCCLGGAKASDALLDRRYGKSERIAFRQTELAAVNLVERLINLYKIDVDRHSDGEIELAHRAKDAKGFQAMARAAEENYGVSGRVYSASDLLARGFGEVFHGAFSTPIGFGLNPRKYLAGLVNAAVQAGARLFEHSPATAIERVGRKWKVQDGQGQNVLADHVIFATNGYSSEHLPPWFAARYTPSQSNVLVTRPLTQTELEQANWTTDMMAYDTRNLLHYFRLMPDGRFLFGMRGALMTGPAAEARARRALQADFVRMFPAWSTVDSEFIWSGMVCLARDAVPFVGKVPGQSGLWAGLCYHGNGVAMGTFSGAILADLVQGVRPEVYPEVISRPLSRFPFGRARRLLMPAVYAGLMLADY